MKKIQNQLFSEGCVEQLLPGLCSIKCACNVLVTNNYFIYLSYLFEFNCFENILFLFC